MIQEETGVIVRTVDMVTTSNRFGNSRKPPVILSDIDGLKPIIINVQFLCKLRLLSDSRRPF